MNQRELSARTRLCVHYNGMTGERCKAGVEYASLQHRLPCIGRVDREGLTPTEHCALYTPRTLEQVVAEEEQGLEFAARVLNALGAVMMHIETTGERSGEIDCPSCDGGRIRYSRALRNGHVWARCSTEGCIAFAQ